MYYILTKGKIEQVNQEISQRGIMPWENDCDNLMLLAQMEEYKKINGKYYDKETIK
jgi:hypothetical protein